METLRFCLLTTFYPPFNFGGDGIDVQRTARALTARGHRVTVVHDVDAYQWLAGRRLPPQPIDQQGVEVIGLRSRLGVGSPLLTHQLGYPIVHGRAIERLMQDRGFDVVVFNNVSLVGGPGLLSLGRGPLKVYVAHEHWLVCPTHVLWRFNREPCDKRACTRCVVAYRRPPQLWRYTNALERQLPNVDLFIARSEFSRLKHAAFGFPKPMHVVPYFIPGDLPAASAGPTTARPHGRPYFLFVGRLTRIKGLETVIPVFARYPDADLLIAGDGEERAALETLAAARRNVKFLGRIDNDQLRRYYEHAVATIVPSLGYETFGIVLIEAFRHGSPVIARGIGPFPEIVDQSGGGLLYTTDDELIAAMSRLQHDHALRDRLAAAAYNACRDRWSEGIVIDRFLQLIADARQRRAFAATVRREPTAVHG
jgi:glycosyltransferase involved in cell wall biosynthesis